MSGTPGSDTTLASRTCCGALDFGPEVWLGRATAGPLPLDPMLGAR
jgi:hypothetical protein